MVLLREAAAGPEVLLLQRSSRIPDRPGTWVFPGGRVDDADLAGDGPDSEGAARRAAVRETSEEAGLTIDGGSLRPISRWITPPESQFKRFDTWFFVARVAADVQVQVDGGEIARHRWLPPQEALALHRDAQSDIVLPPPTFVTLHWVDGHPDPDTAVSALAQGPFLTFRPQIHARDDGACILYPLDAGYEARDPDLPGARHRLWTSSHGYRYERSGC